MYYGEQHSAAAWCALQGQAVPFGGAWCWCGRVWCGVVLHAAGVLPDPASSVEAACTLNQFM